MAEFSLVYKALTNGIIFKNFYPGAYFFCQNMLVPSLAK